MKIRCWVNNRLIYPNKCECESVQFLSATYKVIGQPLPDIGIYYKYLEVVHDLECNHKPLTITMKGDWRLAHLFEKFAEPMKIGGVVDIPDKQVEREVQAVEN